MHLTIFGQLIALITLQQGPSQWPP